MATETDLPARYEIRVLQPEHVLWANAIVCHSNVFNSPVWSVLYANKPAAKLYSMLSAADYLVRHQVESGLSLGIFDTEYKFRSTEAEAVGGKLLWDMDPEHEPGRDALAEAMDFPLVSVALAYDSINALDMEKMGPLFRALPEFVTVYHALLAGDARDPQTWTAAAPGEVLFRNATATKTNAEGHGFMGKLARYMMRKSAGEGWRGIQIECAHDAVTHVWSEPPAPFRGEVVSEFQTYDLEVKDEEGNESHPLRPAKQRCTKVYVTLK